MKVSIVYIYPPSAGTKYDEWAVRFIQSYRDFPPGINHESVIVVNGSKVDSETRCMFSSFPNLRFIEHDNSGYDIGAYQRAAHEVQSDLVVFFGTSTTFRKTGWLMRMAGSANRQKNCQFGTMGNRGDGKVNVYPHIRTTAFWMHPDLMRGYPTKIERPEQRYQFEHGPSCLTSWLTKRGIISLVVTWEREYEWKDWDSDPNGFHRGNQSAMLAYDHLCDPPYYG